MLRSATKAGLLSGGVLLVLLSAFWILRPRGSRPGAPRDPGDGPSAADAPRAPRAAAVRGGAGAPGRLLVSVVEAGTGRRIQRGRILLERGTLGASEASLGELELTTRGTAQRELPPGPYVLEARCPLHRKERREVTLRAGEDLPVRFELAQGLAITGRVVSAAGEPVAGARVAAIGDPWGSRDTPPWLDGAFLDPDPSVSLQAGARKEAEAITALDGSFQLDGLDGIRFLYELRATASGHGPGTLSDVSAPREDVEIRLAAGKEAVVHVVDEERRSVGGARVRAFLEEETANIFEKIFSRALPPIAEADADAGGVVRFSTLGSGLYSFQAEASGKKRGTTRELRLPTRARIQIVLEKGAILRGVVVGPDSEAVSGADLRVTPREGDSQPRQERIGAFSDELRATSDETGAFTFEGLGAGTHILICSHPHYATLRQLDLHVREDGGPLTLRLDRGRRLWGRVVDAATERPIPGAEVKVGDPGPADRVARADGDGVYVLEGIQAGSRPFQAIVTAQGYGRLWSDIDFKGAEDLEKDLFLDRASQVRAQVVNAAGEPVTGAQGRVWGIRRGVQTRIVVGRGTSDEAGQLVVEDVEPAHGCSLEVRATGYLDGSSPTFDVEPASDLVLSPILLASGGAASGTVTGPDGKAIAGAVVTFATPSDSDADVSLHASSTTDSSGAFRLGSLPPGIVELIARAPRRLEARVPGIAVVEGQETSGLAISMAAARSVAGRVSDASGAPIPDALVTCRDYSSGLRELRAMAEGDGSFRVDGIGAARTVELEVSSPGHAPALLPAVPVGRTDVSVVLEALASVEGEVVDADGQPVGTFTVELIRASAGTTRRSFRTPRGEFLVEGLVPGVYTGRVSAPGAGFALLPEARLARGERAALGRIVLEPDGVLRGQVVDALTGQGIAGAQVHRIRGVRSLAEWTATGGRLEGDDVTLADGSGFFEFRGVPAVSHTLRAAAEGYGEALLSGALPEGLPGAQEARIALDSRGSIAGTVVEGKAKPVGGISVYLMGSDPAANRFTKADASGAYTFEGVPAGKYTVKAHRFETPEAAALAGEAALTLRAGQRATVTIRAR